MNLHNLSSHLVIECLKHIWTKLWGLGIITTSSKRFHHTLSKFEFAIGHFRVLTLMFALMAEELSAGMQHIVATCADAMDVIANTGKPTALEGARFMLHELLEAIST
jgi:hypothetical protein